MPIFIHLRPTLFHFLLGVSVVKKYILQMMKKKQFYFALTNITSNYLRYVKNIYNKFGVSYYKRNL